MSFKRAICFVLCCIGMNAYADGPAFPVRCYPPADVTLSAYKFDVAPDSYTSKWNKAISFRDECTKALVVQLYNDDELNQFKWDIFDLMKMVRGGLTPSQAITIWAQAQPIRNSTAEEIAWRKVLEAKYAVPVPVCKITAQSATVLDRQVYKANAAKTAPGTAVTGVRVAAGTACGAQLGTTSYRSVAGQKDTQGRVIADGYAIGAVQ